MAIVTSTKLRYIEPS